jgi:hypothetical protein
MPQLHLATCVADQPHVSLMNYTYLPSSPYSAQPVIVMTTNPASKKANNLLANSNVSLLVHDWVSHRPPTSTARRMSGSPERPEPPSSLASLLYNLNSSAMSSISATIGGVARLVESDTQEEGFYRQRHLENNTFDEENGTAAAAARDLWLAGRRESVADGPAMNGDGAGNGRFVVGEEVRVVVVTIRDVRISDWKGSVRDWVLEPAEESHLVNGIGG